MTRLQESSFTVSMTCISKLLIARDDVRFALRKKTVVPAAAGPVSIASGTRSIQGFFWGAGEGAPVVLLCHGIAERLSTWLPVRELFAQNGVATLVFHYSGYGGSSGVIRPQHCEEDAKAAYAYACELAGGAPVWVLGFSMGSGIAAEIAAELTPAPAGLILCEAFTNFRDASSRVGFPRLMHLAVAPIWDTVSNVRALKLPVLVLHSDRDRLFPMKMAEEIAASSPDRIELHRKTGHTHNQPITQPRTSYWGSALERIKRSQR